MTLTLPEIKLFKHKTNHNLQNTVKSILVDEELKDYFSKNVEKNSGLELGVINYWSDITVYVHHGLCVNFESRDENLKIFTYQNTNRRGKKTCLQYYDDFPNVPPASFVMESDEYEDMPSGKQFIQKLNFALENLEKNIVYFSKKDKNLI
ncbi:hypothetical protein K9L67_00295 [Candidatus Woesearchaeota archaeon]|nr:hypothetical protein [Candidatus Woesearchaeota archaeon]MCF7900646.1 hypothetical protein [Candidatus Woesearchaeota archaeon]MCF8013486.1 hypothetical protein [Candidatus Woesearchaeota archaeon]